MQNINNPTGPKPSALKSAKQNIALTSSLKSIQKTLKELPRQHPLKREINTIVEPTTKQLTDTQKDQLVAAFSNFYKDTSKTKNIREQLDHLLPDLKNRNVSFSEDNQVVTIPNRASFSEIEKSNLWYSHHDMSQMKKDNSREIRELKNQLKQQKLPQLLKSYNANLGTHLEKPIENLILEGLKLSPKKVVKLAQEKLQGTPIEIAIDSILQEKQRTSVQMSLPTQPKNAAPMKLPGASPRGISNG